MSTALRWMITGGVLALFGVMIILWPERGLTPHPLPFPPSESTQPIAGYAVFGYPLLADGVLVALVSAVAAAIAAIFARSNRLRHQ